MRHFLSTLDTTDFLSLPVVFIQISAQIEWYGKIKKQLFTVLLELFSPTNLNKRSIKYQSCPKYTKINAFKQKNMHMSHP